MRFSLPRVRPLRKNCVYPSFQLHRQLRLYTDMADIQINKTAHPFDKTRFEALLNRRFFYAPAFEIYGGVSFAYHHYRFR